VVQVGEGLCEPGNRIDHLVSNAKHLAIGKAQNAIATPIQERSSFLGIGTSGDFAMLRTVEFDHKTNPTTGREPDLFFNAEFALPCWTTFRHCNFFELYSVKIQTPIEP
jgi:hypothetical protein